MPLNRAVARPDLRPTFASRVSVRSLSETSDISHPADFDALHWEKTAVDVAKIIVIFGVSYILL